MAIRKVLQLGDPRLRETCAAVTDPTSLEIAQIITDLADTLVEWRKTSGYGRGIAAPQIGVLSRIVFLDVDRRSPWPLINPHITERSDETMVVWDGCLSFLSVFCQVRRYNWVTVQYQDLAGASHQMRAEGNLSELLQHELDHLDGILTLDRMLDIQTLCSREEFEHRYRANSPYARVTGSA